MFPTPLPSHIVDAWTFVHGAQWCFESLPPGPDPVVEPALAVTVSLSPPDGRTSLLVGCLIRLDDAEALARHMFSPPDGEVTADDVRDAGQEACNVLAGSVLANGGGCPSLGIGLPQALTLPQYHALAQGAQVRARYVGRPSAGDSAVRVVLSIFEMSPEVQDRESHD